MIEASKQSPQTPHRIVPSRGGYLVVTNDCTGELCRILSSCRILHAHIGVLPASQPGREDVNMAPTRRAAAGMTHRHIQHGHIQHGQHDISHCSGDETAGSLYIGGRGLSIEGLGTWKPRARGASRVMPSTWSTWSPEYRQRKAKYVSLLGTACLAASVSVEIRGKVTW
jgi:hypothetical protein